MLIFNIIYVITVLIFITSFYLCGDEFLRSVMQYSKTKEDQDNVLLISKIVIFIPIINTIILIGAIIFAIKYLL